LTFANILWLFKKSYLLFFLCKNLFRLTTCNRGASN